MIRNLVLVLHHAIQVVGLSNSCLLARSRSARTGFKLRPWRLKRRLTPKAFGIDVHLDVFLHCARAALDGWRSPTSSGVEPCRDLPPGINAVPVAQQVANQCTKLLGLLLAQLTGEEGFQSCFAVGVTGRLHQTAKLGLIRRPVKARTACAICYRSSTQCECVK